MQEHTENLSQSHSARLVALLIDANNLDQWKDASFARALANALVLALTADQLSAFMAELETAGVAA